MNQSHLWLPLPQPLPGSRQSLCLDGDIFVWVHALPTAEMGQEGTRSTCIIPPGAVGRD